MSAGALADRLSLIVITDPECGPGRSIVDVVSAAIQAGTPAVQLRDKSGDVRQMLALAARLLQVTRPAGALLFVNDRLDVALAAGADGVHAGDDDLPVGAMRTLVPGGFLIGRSVDDMDGAKDAAAAGADYVGVGPVRATPTKPDAGPALGVEGVRRVSAAVDLPVVAIGGVDVCSAEEIGGGGAAGVAVIRAVMQARDPGRAASDLIAAVSRGRAGWVSSRR